MHRINNFIGWHRKSQLSFNKTIHLETSNKRVLHTPYDN